MTTSFRIDFPADQGDYLSALSRGRWLREFGKPCEGLDGALDVFDLRSLPAPGSGEALAEAAASFSDATIFSMDSAAAEKILRWSPPPVSTLREFEAVAGSRHDGWIELALAPQAPPARFRPSGTAHSRLVAARGFRVLRVPESFGVREEILALIPENAKRLLDVGCGAGETAGEARRRMAGLRATGIESHEGLARAARARLDDVVAADATDAFELLDRRGQRFDTMILADFLEHTADPYFVLKASLRLAEPGATVIVSVPNAACIPVLEDLLVGRFDPIGAGVEDAGHLRWFTRRLLNELLEAAGLRDIRIRPVPVPSDGTQFLERLRAAGIPHREDDLCAIQWIATATVAKD